MRAIVFVPGAGGWSYRAAFPLPVLQRAARAFVEWFPLRRSRCLGRSPAVQLLAKQQNLMGEHGTWSIGRARTCAVDDRVRDVCYANRPVVAGGPSSDDERGRGRAGQRQWPWHSGVSTFLFAETRSPAMRHGFYRKDSCSPLNTGASVCVR